MSYGCDRAASGQVERREPLLSSNMSRARLTRSALMLALTLASAGCGAAEAVTPELINDGCGIPRTMDCESPSGIAAGSVSVAPTATGITIVNQTERPVYLFAVNAETLALLDWAPCTGGTNCPALAQGAQRDIAWADIYWYAPTVKQYTVYWWNVTVQPDGTARAENLHSVTISR